MFNTETCDSGNRVKASYSSVNYQLKVEHPCVGCHLEFKTKTFGICADRCMRTQHYAYLQEGKITEEYYREYMPDIPKMSDDYVPPFISKKSPQPQPKRTKAILEIYKAKRICDIIKYYLDINPDLSTTQIADEISRNIPEGFKKLTYGFIWHHGQVLNLKFKAHRKRRKIN